MIYELKTRNELSVTPIKDVYTREDLMGLIEHNELKFTDKVYFLNSEKDRDFRKTFEVATTPSKADKLIISLFSKKKTAYVTMCDDGYLLTVDQTLELIRQSIWETAIKMKEILDIDPEPQFLILNKDNQQSRYTNLNGFNRSLSDISYNSTIIFKFADSIDISKMISENVYFKMHDTFDKDTRDSIVGMLNSSDQGMFSVGQKMLMQYDTSKLNDIVYILSRWHRSRYEDDKISAFIRRLGLKSNYYGTINFRDALGIIDKFNPPDAQEIMAIFDEPVKEGWVRKIVRDEKMDTNS